MNKYLLSILAAGAIASVSQAQTLTPIAFELWTFDDAAGLSFQSATGTNAGFANTGSNGSLWNFGGFKSGGSTDGIGNLVVTGNAGTVMRKTSPTYSPAIATGVYRLTLDISAWDMTAGSILIDAAADASGNTRVAALKFEHRPESTTGTGEEGDPVVTVPAYARIQAIIKSTSSASGGYVYRAYDVAESGATPISAYIEFDFDNDTAEFVVDGDIRATVTDFESADLTMLRFSQDANFVETNEVRVDSMGLYQMVDQQEDTDGDGIADFFETNTGTWVSTTDTGTDPAVADTEVAGVDIALYNYIAALDSSSGSVGGGAITQQAYDAVVADKDAAEAAQATAEAAQATAETAQATAETALANAPTLADVEQTVMDARADSTRIDVSDGVASITLTLEETSAVSDWSSATTSEQTFQVNAPAGTSFYRFKIAD